MVSPHVFDHPKRKDFYRDFLPNLQTLSLSAASLAGSWDRLINAFNLCGVKELHLRNCGRAVELLKHLAGRNNHLHATKAELALPEAEMDLRELHAIDFLAPFTGLEDLFLMFESDFADTIYIDMILRHRGKLRSLVYHKRYLCTDELYEEEYRDSSLLDSEGVRFADVLCETEFESVGVCGKPSSAQKSFQSIASKVDSLKLLHLRFTGKAEQKPKFSEEDDFYSADSPSPDSNPGWLGTQFSGTTRPRCSAYTSESKSSAEPIYQTNDWRENEKRELEALADWAFSPDGFPNLKILASGDFSHGDPFIDIHVLRCRKSSDSRNQTTWRTVEQSDVSENELINANMDLLSACPVSPLFYRYGLRGSFAGIS